MNRKITRDRRFLLYCISFILGIFFFPYINISPWILFFLSALAAVFVFICTDEKAQILSFAVLFVIFGFLRFSFYEKISDVDENLRKFDNRKIELECEVADMPEIKNGKQQVVLKVKDKNFPDGRILAFMSAFGDYSYGDTVKFSGTLKLPENFDNFDYRKYLFQKNIYFISYYPQLEQSGENRGGLYKAIYDFRKAADRNLTKLMPSPQGNILSAMILGMNSDEIKNIMDNFNKTGTSHIIVVSGSHLVIVIAILMFLFLQAGINRNKIFYLVILGIVGFIILSGSASAAIRSGIMACVFLFAVKIGRPKSALNALIFSATLMIFISPYILTGDVSFQLSFLATFGVVYILPRLQSRFRNFREYGGTKDILLTTLAAQIATFPVIIINFGQFSFLSFLANVLILPTVPVVMVGGFLLVGLSFASFDLAQIAAFPIYLILCYQLLVVSILSNTDFGLIKF